MRRLSEEEFSSSKFREAWLALSREVLIHDIGQTNAWSNQWWKKYRFTGVGKKELFVLVDENDGLVDCIWPLMIRKIGGIRVVEFIGQSGGMTTDYMAPLVRTGHEKQAFTNFSAYLAENTNLWDAVELRVPAWTGFYQMFLENQCVRSDSKSLSLEIGIADHALVIEMPGDFETYVSSLGKRTRQDVRKYLRAADQAEARFDILQGQDLTEQLQSLYELNARNWSIFEDIAARHFMTECVGGLLRDKTSLFLARLSILSNPCAMVLGYQSNGRCFLHPAGVVREKVAKLSPGITLYAMLIRKLIDDKISLLDMSPGLEEYKFRLGATAEPVYLIRFSHEHSRIRRWRAINWARSAASRSQWVRSIYGKFR